MFNETELVSALEYSAERADFVADTSHTVRPTSRRAVRIALPALAAATVVGVVSTAVIVTGGSSFGRADKAVTGGTPSVHVPVAVAVNDLVSVHNPEAEYDIRRTDGAAYNAEYVDRPVRNAAGPALVVLPKSANFDPGTRFSHVQRINIDGVSAYYGTVVLHPANGKVDQDTDKHGGAQRALGIRKVDGTWLFVTSDNFAPTALSGLVSAYKQMHVIVRSGTVKIPIRTGFVPGGMTLDSVATAGINPVSSVRLTDGGKSIDINIGFPGNRPAGQVFAAKQIGKYVVQLTSHGYDQATADKVLATMQFGDPTDRGKTWWTIEQALG